MGSCAGESLDATKEAILFTLTEQASEYGIKLQQTSLSVSFNELINRLYEKGPVVVLVDEYDKPLLNKLGEESVLEYQKLLKDFYGVIKTCEDKLRFAFITGISKFSKVSIFSDLNNLTDLTMNRDAGTLLGYTQEELEFNFSEYVTSLGAELSLNEQETLNKLKTWYNGYRFEEEAPTVYNPVSVMKCFAELKIKNYWFETATPTFLINLLKKQPILPDELTLPETSFSAYEPDHLQALPLLVQTGYLTIKSSITMGGRTMYELGYPNFEVEQGFSENLLKGMAELPDVEMGVAIRKIYQALESGDVDALLKQVMIFFKGIPHNIQLKHETYYQSLFVALFRVIGAFVQAEVCTSDGRIDAVLRSPKQVLVMEFKLRDTAEAAMTQIKAKDYGLAWGNETTEVLLVGVGFDQNTRNIDKWVIEKA
ncbi:MAG: AAA family ATPase [Planctomycetes bacterium]|nr:AAA family ATPase [Planctomycetota bacterium]